MDSFAWISSRPDLFGELAGAIGRILYFVVEHGKVQRQSQSDRMCRLHTRLGYLLRIPVGRLRPINDG
jgi:hypothetical protein